MAKSGDLSVTALYTSAAWHEAGYPNAELVLHPKALGVFRAVNGTLALTRGLRAGTEAPLPMALAQRHTLIDRLVAESGARSVIELAAGLSQRGITLTADPSLAVVEVDQPHVLAIKRELLARTPAGQAILARPNLTFMASDVTELDVAALCASQPAGPVFVIAEGLLMYLDVAAQNRLASRVAEALRPRGGQFVFDYVPPSEKAPPGATGRALEWLMKRFTAGQSFVKDPRTREAVAEDLRSSGFDRAEVLEPRHVAARYALPHPEAPTEQLLFVCGVK